MVAGDYRGGIDDSLSARLRRVEGGILVLMVARRQRFPEVVQES